MKEGDLVICVNNKNIDAKIKNIPFVHDNNLYPIYSIRMIVKNLNGSYGILLNEIKNDNIQVKFFDKNIEFEPNFGLSRFLYFDTTSIEKEYKKILNL